jgi:hypothetical protein
MLLLRKEILFFIFLAAIYNFSSSLNTVFVVVFSEFDSSCFSFIIFWMFFSVRHIF